MAPRLSALEIEVDCIVWYTDDELGRSIYLRVELAGDDRWVISELYVPPADGPMTTDDLRRIPLGRIEARCNDPDSRRRLTFVATTGTEHVSLEDMAILKAPHHGSRPMERRPTLRQSQLRLRVPDGRRDYGDDFYRRVAEIYRRLVDEGRPPAPTIAEANAVPLSTAQRWAKESRRRGFLSAGRTGKVG